MPGVPSSISIGTETATSVCLIVRPPRDDGGAALSGYRVEYNSQMEFYGTASNELCIDNLRPGNSYEFSVYAENSVGSGAPYVFTYVTAGIVNGNLFLTNTNMLRIEV